MDGAELLGVCVQSLGERQLTNRHPLLTLLIPLSLIALFFVVALLVGLAYKELVSGDPFVMQVNHRDGESIVQFFNPTRERKSPEFKVTREKGENFRVELVSNEAKIPGGAIEFYDATVLPGRFTILFAGTKFDVMGGVIIVNGQAFDWLPKHLSNANSR